jgi:hypothetical protein
MKALVYLDDLRTNGVSAIMSENTFALPNNDQGPYSSSERCRVVDDYLNFKGIIM